MSSGQVRERPLQDSICVLSEGLQLQKNRALTCCCFAAATKKHACAVSINCCSQGIFNRHEEIRLALRFFLQAVHKHKQAGSVPDKQRVLYDFVRYKGLRPVVERLSTPSIKPADGPKGR
jgi:uncharacterized UBP type Zn finger protein